MTSDNAARLAPTRDAVLGLHRALLAAERIAWEAMNGRIAGGGSAGARPRIDSRSLRVPHLPHIRSTIVLKTIANFCRPTPPGQSTAKLSTRSGRRVA